MNKPEVGEFFISKDGAFCEMIEEDYYSAIYPVAHNQVRQIRGLGYIAESPSFSKLRDCLASEIINKLPRGSENPWPEKMCEAGGSLLDEIEDYKRTLTKRGEKMNSEFTIEMEDGHDTTQGLKYIEAVYIEHVYRLAKYNQVKASKMLGISRGCLRMKLKTYFDDQYL